MLREGDRLIKPEDILKQIPAKDLEGVIILGLAKKGEVNKIYMSSITVEEISFLSAQLSAHVTCLLGPMDEG